MSFDLFTLRHALQNAADDRDAADKGAAFTARVRREITALFEDPECPRRRHSFAVIRRRLGVFDENDPELREILFSMGAQVCKGKGEAAIWELIHADTPAPPPHAAQAPAGPASWAVGAVVCRGSAGWQCDCDIGDRHLSA